jgi:bacteriocin resistance YdeI/OmpD-like protein/uncharacterized protein DUF1905
MKFKTTLRSAGKTATGIEIPPEVIAELGAGKKPAVKVTLNGFTYRSTVASRGERFLVGVSAVNREGAGVAAGDTLEATIELDTEPRVVEVPKDMAEALAAKPKAKAFYETLTFSQQHGFIDPITEAKKPETRVSRIEKAVAALAAGRKR